MLMNKISYLRALIIIVAMILTIGLLTGCAEQPVDPENGNGDEQSALPGDNGVDNGEANGIGVDEEMVFEQGFYRPDEQNLPDEIRQWITYSRELQAVQEREYDGYRFVLVTMGTKPTGGYSIEVVDVVSAEEELVVNVQTQEPAEGDPVTTAITYPYDLVIVEEQALPLRAIDIDESDRYFMSVYGIDYIDQPIVASSEWIKVFSPEPNEKVWGSFKLTGLTSVFEGTVSYELISNTGDVIGTGFTTGMMGDWGYFEEEIQIPSGTTGDILLELYSVSMKDGSKMFVVEIPLVVEN
ncbi:Gmad2 immunoglobulin-like domain-containing protein [Desulfuribacillus alkaliarsenatis]|uniref:PrcB C-terminal domain-containing protein n=1 Tax=Desulfuribacillus alkaliarsenatis TaxID=766136 RepID=A0A1E5G389_9FIRM|nr:Gmad2 immunoglobulin-like domain-containing protein [Desulfuribacillus alkaliarsenatis]OEF97454.1 hypothetical protein BHF68_04395 [Desulfuribacillus alkaliarsenatis]